MSSMSNSNSTAIVQYEQPTDAVRDTMMTGMVAPSTLKAYRIEQLKFITYLYDTNADKFISDSVLQIFHEAHQKDQENDKSKKTRKHLRKCIKEHLKKMNRYDNNCPVVLQHVSFSEFTKYMLDFRSKDEDGVLHYLSKSAYGHMKSAFGNLFKTSGQNMESVLAAELNQFSNSLSRKIAEAKVSSGQSLDEGKKPMSFAVYQLMCRKLLESDQADTLFAHTYLVLEWNLMARAHMIADMDVAHIEWGQDSLIFFFGKSKRNQTGEDADRPFHVYSNPENPEVCPVLALATYLVAYPDVLRTRGLLFPGSSQYSRFLKTFHATIEKHEDEFKSLGVSKGDLGSHSCRKGAITLVTTGCTVSPPMAAVCLRAGWTMGPVKDRYIFYEKAGDQFVGRTVTGMPSLDSIFAVSPVYWDWSGLSPDQERDKKESLEEIMCAIIDKKDVPAATLGLMRFLLAAIVKHYEFLKKTLDEQNKLNYSSGFLAMASVHDDLKAHAVVRLPWERTQFTPKTSGIPPYVLLLNKIEAMDKQNKQILTFPEKILEGVHTEFEDLKQSLSRELTARQVGGPEFGARQIMEEFREETKEILHEMREMNTGKVSRDTVEEEDNVADSFNNKAAMDWQAYVGTGKAQVELVPEGYTIGHLNFSSFITTWYCGNPPKKVAPYRMLRGENLPEMVYGCQILSQMKKLISHVERAAKELANRPELVIEGRSWTPRDCTALHAGIAHFFCVPEWDKETRFSQLSWKTFFNKMEKRKWQLVGEKAGEEMHVSPPATTTNNRGKKKRKRRRNVAATSTRKKRNTRNTSNTSNSGNTNIAQEPDPFAIAFGNIELSEEAKERGEKRCHVLNCVVITDFQKYRHLDLDKKDCRAPGCTDKVHHLCSNQNGWGEHNDCCCSEECWKRLNGID